MADRFLREVERMQQLRRDINEMTPEEADELAECPGTRGRDGANGAGLANRSTTNDERRRRLCTEQESNAGCKDCRSGRYPCRASVSARRRSWWPRRVRRRPHRPTEASGW